MTTALASERNVQSSHSEVRGSASKVTPPGFPKVTVLVTCHNYGHFLTQCVTSALEQDGVDVSVLVIDDASTDQSASVAESLARRDPRVRVMLLRQNVGVIRAVNYGLQEIDGEYFVKLDADDLLSAGSLKRSVSLLERNPHVGFVYGRPRTFFDSGSEGTDPRWTIRSALEEVVARGGPRSTVWSGAEWLSVRYARGLNCISQPEAVIRTSALRNVGEYNVALPHTYDFEMWLRLATVADVGRVNRVVQGYYRVHPKSQQRTVNAGLLTDLVGRRDAFISALSGAAQRVKEAPKLETLVRQKLAAEALDKACRAYDRDRVEASLEEKLVRFALATCPAAATLPEWTSLKRRQSGRRRSRLAVASLSAAAIRRAGEEIGHFRWVRTGI